MIFEQQEKMANQKGERVRQAIIYQWGFATLTSRWRFHFVCFVSSAFLSRILLKVSFDSAINFQNVVDNYLEEAVFVVYMNTLSRREEKLRI